MPWFGSIEHNRWLSKQMHALLEFGHNSRVPLGFGYMNSDGSVDPKRPVELYITARMTHIYSLGTHMGIPGCRSLADHGVNCLRRYFLDHEHGGWYDQIAPELDEDENAVPIGMPWKQGYGQAFVLLAAASATSANRPAALDLLHDAMHEHEKHWWDTRHSMLIDECSFDFSQTSDYRGMNANMHATEAFLAVADVMDDPVWLDRAVDILHRAYKNAKDHDWRLPEHYDEEWRPILDYNRDEPDHQFRPYGATVGHGMEWARLALHARASIKVLGRTVPDWLLEMATEMFERARVDAWRKNGYPGFVYTTDFQGKPIVTQRFWWVACEGVMAATAMRRALLDDGAHAGELEHYEHCYRSWLDYLAENHIKEPGRWQMELTPECEPSTKIWPGQPDIYHSIQMLLLPRLPLAPCFSTALGHDLLDKPELPKPRARRKGGMLWWLGD